MAKMLKMGMMAAAALMSVGVASSAQAVVVFNFDGTSGGISAYALPRNPSYTFTFNPITLSTAGTFTASLTTSTSRIGGATDFDFTSVTLFGGSLSSQGLAFTSLSPAPGFERRDLETFLDAGTYSIVVNGVSRGAGSYGGQLTFAAVPESATWAMMLVGFGGMGTVLRRSRKTRVNFAI